MTTPTRLAEIAEREAFEEEHRLMFELRSAAYDRCNGRYIDYRTEHDFRVWQAEKAAERSASADWEAKFKAHTEAVQAFLAEMMAVYDPCASDEMPVREVCAFLVKQTTDDRQRFYDQEAQLTAAQARSREDAEIMRAAIMFMAVPEHHRCPNCAYYIANGASHAPDCLVTRLRARADEDGGTDK